jgi:hypothetical protein
MTAADHDQCPWCKGWGHDGMDCPYVNQRRRTR